MGILDSDEDKKVKLNAVSLYWPAPMDRVYGECGVSMDTFPLLLRLFLAI